MELLLNLLWLLLAMPAFLLWRDCGTAPDRQKSTALQCFLALGCMLVLLFPVVSATDDLRAMRAEMEETPLSKRSVGQSSGDKTSAWKSSVQPALAVTWNSLSPVEHSWIFVLAIPLSTPSSPPVFRAGRAPPPLLLS